MIRAINFIANGTPWAMEKSALDTIIAISKREHDLQAVLQSGGEPLDNTRNVINREGIAIIPVNGPLFPRANLFDEISGATSVEMLASDFATAQNDPDIRATILMIDSPGGHTTMINEFSNQIAAASKPVIAYVVGQAASAAYWIASAADSIVLDAAAIVGSIGVVAAIQKGDADTIEIVSSNASEKRPDVETDDGRAVVLSLVDDMEAVFVNAVMAFRIMTHDQVTGLKGGVLVGEKAIKQGFADRVGSLEQVINQLKEENPMDLQTLKSDHPGVYQAVFNAGVESVDPQKIKTDALGAEHARISAILNHEESVGREAQAKVLALETDMQVDAAAKVLAASPKVEPTAIKGDQFSKYMASLGNPDVGVDADEQDDSATKTQAAIDLILGGTS